MRDSQQSLTVCKKSIRFIIGSLNMGGAERHLSYLLPALKKRGWHVYVMTLSHDLTLAPVFKDAGIEVLPPGYTHRYHKMARHLPTLCQRIWRLYAHVQHILTSYNDNPKDITHCFLPESYILTAFARGFYAIFYGWRREKLGPFLMARRSTRDYQKRRPVLGWIERCCHFFVDHITVNSQRNLDDMSSHEGITPSNITLIYNGIDVEHELTHQHHALFTMIMVANFYAYKGHMDVIHALSRIKKTLDAHHPQGWHMVFIGHDRGSLPSCKDEAKRLNLINNIAWIEHCDDPKPYFKNADMGILASHEEGFSNALLEKMAAGLPCVVTDVGGNAEAIHHEQHGFVVPRQSPERLADGILKLATDENLRRRMSHHVHKRAQQFFSLTHMLDQYEDLYKRYT